MAAVGGGGGGGQRVVQTEGRGEESVLSTGDDVKFPAWCLGHNKQSVFTPFPPLTETSGWGWPLNAPSSFSDNDTLASEGFETLHPHPLPTCGSALPKRPQKPHPGKKSLLLGLQSAWGARGPPTQAGSWKQRGRAPGQLLLSSRDSYPSTRQH